MLINEVLTKDQSPEHFKSIVIEQCQPFLSAIGGLENFTSRRYFLYRGLIPLSRKQGYEIVSSPTDRGPRSTSIILHEMTTNAMKKLGFVARRDNSLFVTSNENEASGYGITYGIIPIGNYYFTWSKNVYDFSIEESIRLMIKQNIIIPQNKETKDRMLDVTFESAHRMIDDGKAKINKKNLMSFIRSNYSADDNIVEAIKSNHEIMMTGKFLMFELDYFKQIDWNT